MFASSILKSLSRAEVSSAVPQRVSSGTEIGSFAQQLAVALQDYLSRPGAASGLQIQIRDDERQTPGARQFLVTVSLPDAGPPRTPAAGCREAESPAVPVGRPLFPETYPLPVEPPARPAMPYRNSADAYWAAQPAEVQELRTIRDRDERERRAYELAAQGFTIDKRIMVRLWDPIASMRSWQEAGYTWIPALGQPDIPVSPGLTYLGRPSYDPNNPPPGSIRVDTSFADGYEY